MPSAPTYDGASARTTSPGSMKIRVIRSRACWEPTVTTTSSGARDALERHHLADRSRAGGSPCAEPYCRAAGRAGDQLGRPSRPRRRAAEPRRRASRRPGTPPPAGWRRRTGPGSPRRPCRGRGRHTGRCRRRSRAVFHVPPRVNELAVLTSPDAVGCYRRAAGRAGTALSRRTMLRIRCRKIRSAVGIPTRRHRRPGDGPCERCCCVAPSREHHAGQSRRSATPVPAVCLLGARPGRAGPAPPRSGDPALEKEAWVSATLLEWGSCGKIVYVDGVPGRLRAVRAAGCTCRARWPSRPARSARTPFC